jgi:mRNA-degrading endonuclease RelE of RelBE toxin-antitoxin system
MQILQFSAFKRAYKKLHPQERRTVDDAIRSILADPELGEAKLGDLAGVRIYKFRLQNQIVLLAYQANISENQLLLLALGPHENFYRDLKH